jgi:exodeoxyribonuclease VII small subunit
MTTETEALTFEAALAQLEVVVSRLESGELSLSESLQTFEEGIHLSRLCTQRLDQAEARVEMLVRSADGGYRAEPFGLRGEGGEEAAQ